MWSIVVLGCKGAGHGNNIYKTCKYFGASKKMPVADYRMRVSGFRRLRKISRDSADTTEVGRVFQMQMTLGKKLHWYDDSILQCCCEN